MIKVRLFNEIVDPSENIHKLREQPRCAIALLSYDVSLGLFSLVLNVRRFAEIVEVRLFHY